MSLTNFPNGISSFGVPIIGGAAMPFTGTHFFVDFVTGSDNNNGLSVKKAFKTLQKAHDSATAGKNDVIYLIGDGASTGFSYITEQLVWDKNAVHLVGICAPSRVANRAKIEWLSSATRVATMIDFSANGCIWANVHVFHDYATAEANTAIAMTGQRNYFSNCHIAGGGHITGAAHADASTMTITGDGENTWEDCTFGVDTITSGAGANGVLVFATAAVRNQFIRCRITKYAGATGGLFCKFPAGSVDRYIIFEDCLFINSNLNFTMTVAMVVDSSIGGYVLVQGGALFGLVTNWVAADNTKLYLCGYMNAGSGNLNTGIAHTHDES